MKDRGQNCMDKEVSTSSLIEFGKSHINGIESFWGVAKTRLSKFKGIHKSTFYLHLKECEFRFNHRNDDLYRLLLNLINKRQLKLF
ncbi:MAG: hypothetical protein A2X49_05880 [Lentisphaerae bacterium GWF2_52_8]|nr:MAG: hypothetical protein A2X49_05880 [Lentisphaerae bacterium GWF2_52_8]